MADPECARLLQQITAHKTATIRLYRLVQEFREPSIFRINFFGFANSPAVPEKNVGFRDQRLAVEWIRDNIAAFGGDPNRMVLGGQSAGAMSTSAYAYAYATDPIVRGLVMESGEVTVTRPDDGTQWPRLAEAIGCRSKNSTDELVCMQKIDAYKLKRVLSPEDLMPLTSAPVARAAVDNVTYFAPAEYVARGSAGHFAKI
ncbi:hypothetical protein PLICBS_003873, partial [Purpureocillium lilacinum]|uniref:uncharacterized protein n=1 Tax=Purpureocillium lilacinum TaxID=33203 RepID=UPI00208D65DA